VRNVVTDARGDETAIIEGMLADIPVDADPDRLMVSALFHGAIPPAFVQCDDPDDATVVSRVLGLNIETDKVALLVSLGRAAQHGDGMDVETIESALDTLADFDDPEIVDAYIRENLL
jgi:hypothetical protein